MTDLPPPAAGVASLKPWFQTLEDTGGLLDWSRFFGNDHPVELDIGCGRGLFVVTAAVANPGTNFLGLELDYREGRRAATRLQKRSLSNARILGGDGRRVLSEMIVAGSVAAAHVYFPDPWWKSRHHKRRLMTPEFIELLTRVVRPGGLIHHWTDVADYFEWASSGLDASPGLQRLPPPQERAAGHDMDYQTSFERKKRKLGLPIFRGLWQRR
jgi:tRNA (guanine-N7-)-methyltransferase